MDARQRGLTIARLDSANGRQHRPRQAGTDRGGGLVGHPHGQRNVVNAATTIGGAGVPTAETAGATEVAAAQTRAPGAEADLSAGDRQLAAPSAGEHRTEDRSGHDWPGRQKHGCGHQCGEKLFHKFLSYYMCTDRVQLFSTHPAAEDLRSGGIPQLRPDARYALSAT